MSRLQVALFSLDELSPDQVKLRIADALASLEDAPTHADALIANQLREQIRTRQSSWSHHHAQLISHPKVALALTIIRKRYADPGLRLAHAASAADLSPWHLARLLVQVTGSGFAENLRRVRVSAAEELLTTTTLSIKEVAYATGYGSSGAFDRAFRQVHARTPVEWRRQHAMNHSEVSQSNPHDK